MTQNVIKISLNDAHILKDIPEVMRKAAVEVLMDQAHLAVGLAQMRVLVDTGSLRNSIRVERGESQVKIRAGGYVVNPRTGRLVDYALFVETRSPFLRPAVDEIQNSVREALESTVKQAIEERLHL